MTTSAHTARSTLLLSAPFSESYDQAWGEEVLSGDPEDVLAVSFDGPDTVVSRLRSRASSFPSRVGILCVDELTRGAAAASTWQPTQQIDIRTVSDPGDLTALGIEITEFVTSRPDEGDMAVSIESVSSLLQYADLDRVYRFLHALSNRLASAGATVVFQLDPEAHDDQTVEVLSGLVDRVVRLADDGSRSTRERPVVA